VQELLAFAAALVALRLAGLLARRWRTRRTPELFVWAAALLAYAVACGALAWGAADGWDGRVFRIYYLFGGLLSAPLLGIGSLLLVRVRWATTIAHMYTWAAVGVAIAMPLTHRVHGHGIPPAQDHLDFVPSRLFALIGNSLGTLAVVGVALMTIRRRPLGNALIVGGVAIAALGSALGGLGEGETAVLLALGALLLYGGFVAPARPAMFRRSLTRQLSGRLTL
jgi:hypothetical protein